VADPAAVLIPPVFLALQVRESRRLAGRERIHLPLRHPAAIGENRTAQHACMTCRKVDNGKGPNGVFRRTPADARLLVRS
jgi:hypothetical protein